VRQCRTSRASTARRALHREVPGSIRDVADTARQIGVSFSAQAILVDQNLERKLATIAGTPGRLLVATVSDLARCRIRAARIARSRPRPDMPSGPYGAGPALIQNLESMFERGRAPWVVWADPGGGDLVPDLTRPEQVTT